jgi:nucleoredoxin
MQPAFFDNPATTLYRQNGECVSAEEALKGAKYVLVYFSAQWCSPCRSFTALLKTFYERHHLNERFVVVFVSQDDSEKEMLEYFNKQHGDYYRLSLTDAKVLTADWSALYDFHTIPTLLVFENVHPRKLLVRRGRKAVVKDPHAKYFPWSTFENPQVRAHM